MAEKNKLKIGFDAKRLFHNNTGLGNYSRNLVRNLYELYPEHEYHLFTPSVSKNDYAQFFLKENFIIHTAPSYLNGSIWRSYFINQKVMQLGLDIYHGLSHEIPYFTASGTKYVVTIHDLIYEKKGELFNSYDTFLYKKKYRYSCKHADAIIAISNSTKKDIKELYGYNEQVKILYQSCANSFQSAEKPYPKRKHFLYVGSIIKRKGLLNIVKAYQHLPKETQLPLIVVGEGFDYKVEVQSWIKENNLYDKVIFKGNIENEDLIALYDESIGLILPSVYEGFGIPLIESLFRGIPVITSNVSSLPEACGPGGLLVDPESPFEIANSMKKLFDDNLWQQLSKDGNNYVNSHFSKVSTTNALVEFYKSLV